jgi:hypothetical protein
MFITKTHIPRRAVLKAAGVSLALPFLDAMVPAGTALAQTAAVPKLRTGFFYIPHGAIMGNTSHGPSLDKWTPSGSGATFTLSPILASLEPYKKYVSSFGNLQNAATAGSVHSFTPATWLSATRPDTGAPRAHMATTLDQVIAKIIGQETTLPSLEVAAETTVQSAAGGGGYYSTLSFRDAESPLPMEPNPRKVFLQLFGEGDTPQERATINTRTNSLLDLILEGTKSLKGRPRERGQGRSRRISRERSRGRAPNAEGGGERSVRVHDSRGSRGRTGLLPRAGEVDVRPGRARVSGGPDAGGFLHHGAEGTNRTYNHIGIPDSFHPVSHHANDLTRIESWPRSRPGTSSSLRTSSRRWRRRQTVRVRCSITRSSCTDRT